MQKIKSVCIIVGAMKAGTSSLFNWLAEHPQISACSVKEPYFFADPNKYTRGLDAYFSLWNFDPDHKIALEGSTDYSKFPYVAGVPQRLKALEMEGYDLKLIYILRDPVARIQSHIRHLYLHRCDVIEKPEVLAPLDAGLLDRFIAFSSYAYQLNQFEPLFRRSQLKLLSFEKMTANPAAAVTEVLEFLNLDVPVDGFIPHGKAANISGSVRTWEHLPKYYRILATNNLVRSRLAPIVPSQIKDRLNNVLTGDHGYRRDLTEAEKFLALERLKPDLIKLRDDWDFDPTGEWGVSL